VQDMLDLATADAKEYSAPPARSPSSRPPTSTTSPRLGNAMGPRVSGAKAPSRGTTPVGLPGTYRKPDLNSMDTAALEAELARRGKPIHRDFSRPSSRPTTGGSVRGMDPADQMPTGMDPADQMPTGMDPVAEGLPGSNMPTAP